MEKLVRGSTARTILPLEGGQCIGFTDENEAEPRLDGSGHEGGWRWRWGGAPKKNKIGTGTFFDF